MLVVMQGMQITRRSQSRLWRARHSSDLQVSHEGDDGRRRLRGANQTAEE